MKATLWIMTALVLVQVGSGEAALVERQVALMGTTLNMVIQARSRGDALEAGEAAVQAVEAVEARLSTWRTDSELACLNQDDSGAEQTISPELAEDLRAAKAWWLATGGAFDPAIGTLVEAWGLRGGRVLPPAPGEVNQALALRGFSEVHLRGGSVVKKLPGLLIEEGGFGKGIGLDAAAKALKNTVAASAVLNLGGQVLVWGRGGPQEVLLAHPKRRAQAVAAFTISNGSVATSGNSERGIEIAGQHYGHLLDPLTGYPAEDFGSMAVWAGDATTADCLSTGLYVLGPEEAFRWARCHPGVEVAVAEPLEKGRIRIRVSGGIARTIRLLDEGAVLMIEEKTPPNSGGYQ